MAERIVREIGEHRVYWEPFCGSMAVLLAKPRCTMETVNDLHGDLINLARVVADETLGSLLYRMLRRVPCSEERHRECMGRLHEERPIQNDTNIQRAFDFFVVSWLGRNGMAGTTLRNNGFCRRFTGNGGHAAKRFAGAVESIPAWRRRFRDVTILRANGLMLLEKIDDAEGTAIYCDPPYFEKGCRYSHDFNERDHFDLSGLLRRFSKAKVVLSYYDHPKAREFYKGWRFEEVAVTKGLANQGMRDKEGKTAAPEMLIVNR